MRALQDSVVRVALAGISLVALYDILAIRDTTGRPAILGLMQVGFKGYGALLARGSGQKPPAGY